MQQHQQASFKEIFLSHSGKVADKWTGYLDIYERELAVHRATNAPILEIGVQNCGSLEIWAKYFSESRQIIGADIAEALETVSFDDDRIEVKICDAKALHLKWHDGIEPPRIIIDDASHQSCDVIRTFISMFPVLASGGTYVIEDLCCSYWREFNENTYWTAMGFLKNIADLVNFEHWGQASALLELATDVGLQQPADLLSITSSIRSIKFYNSICFIEKNSETESQEIGRRSVVGKSTPLGFKATSGQGIHELGFSKSNLKLDRDNV